MGHDKESPHKSDDFKQTKQYIATCCVSLGAICSGTVLSWTSPVIPQLEIPKNETNITMATDSLRLTETECGIVGSILAVGALVSSLPSGIIADRFGRKPTLISLSVPFLISWILIAFAQNAITLYIARFLAGVGTGAMCVCAPMFIGEIAHPSIRGKLGSFFQLFICIGILLSYSIGALVKWKMLSIILGCFPIMFAVAVYMIPETPEYLFKKDRLTEANKSIIYYYGNNNMELQKLFPQAFESEKSAGFVDLFKSKGNRKALFAALGCMCFQQLSGINAVIFYSVSIFKAAGSTLSSNISSILVGALQVVVAYLAAMLMEKANRKVFLIFSALGMGACMTILAITFQLKDNGITSAFLNFLPIASLLLYIVAFSFGFGPVPWMVMGELFAPEIKGPASGLAVLSNWALTFVVTFAFPVMNSSLGGHVTFYIFTGLTCLAALFVLKCMPETRGKTLQEIQEILNR